MKLSKNQLKKIIKEYLEIQSQPLNEGVKGTYLVNELVKSFDVSDDAKTKLVNAINLVNDTAVRVGYGSVDEYITGAVGPLSKIGIFSSGAVNTVAGMAAAGMATFALFSVIPSALYKTIDNLSSVEGKLRNLRDAYKDIRSERADRVNRHGMDPEDTDFDGSSTAKELSKNLGIEQYTFDDIIKHLAAEAIDVRGDKIEMKTDAIAAKLAGEGVISDKFFKLVKKEFQRQRAEMENIPEKLKEKFYEVLLAKAKKVAGKPDAAKQAAKEFAEVGLDVMFPEAKNVITMVFRLAGNVAIAKA